MAYYIITGGCSSAPCPNYDACAQVIGDIFLLDQIYHVITYKYYYREGEILEGYERRDHVIPEQATFL